MEYMIFNLYNQAGNKQNFLQKYSCTLKKSRVNSKERKGRFDVNGKLFGKGMLR